MGRSRGVYTLSVTEQNSRNDLPSALDSRNRTIKSVSKGHNEIHIKIPPILQVKHNIKTTSTYILSP